MDDDNGGIQQRWIPTTWNCDNAEKNRSKFVIEHMKM